MFTNPEKNVLYVSCVRSVGKIVKLSPFKHVVAFASIVMTYFGVNYYLSGLHSYAAGDPIPVPAWVYIGTATMFALAIGSYFKLKSLTKTS